MAWESRVALASFVLVAAGVAGTWTSSNEERGLPPHGYNPAHGWTPGPMVDSTQSALAMLANWATCMAVAVLLALTETCWEIYRHARKTRSAD